MACKFLNGDGVCELATQLIVPTVTVVPTPELCKRCLPHKPTVDNVPQVLRDYRSQVKSHQPLPKQPSLPQKIINYTKAITTHIVTGRTDVSDDVYLYRVSKCEPCEFYVDNVCSLCGCRGKGANAFVSKLKMPNQRCPLEPPKWLAIDKDGNEQIPHNYQQNPEALEGARINPKDSERLEPLIEGENAPLKPLALLPNVEIAPVPTENVKEEPKPPAMTWAYGVTTVIDREKDLLPRTLQSLRKAGFDKPRLFVDDCSHLKATEYYSRFNLEVSNHFPRIKSYGNWLLAMMELWIRDPHADRYAIFQDDFVTYPNLREYLEKVGYPTKGYCNLYTFPCNAARKPKDLTVGWYRSDQRGQGAVALVFSNEAVELLMTTKHMIRKPKCDKRGTRAIDGGIVEAYRGLGWDEFVHCPSLVQHTGSMSSMGNKRHPLSPTFKGESFDVLSLLESK